MRKVALAAAAFVLVSCSQDATPVASVSPSSAPVSPFVTPASPLIPSPVTPGPSPQPCTQGSPYGLLISGGRLELITNCGAIPASAALAPSSVQLCSPGGQAAVLMPPVSASNDTVYFRDGDNRIRSLSPTGQTADVTTVPGGPNTVSFFSVSPDDQRIAVVVEDLSSPDSVAIRLYVEDLSGGGHHADIFAKSTPKSGGDTLWPMGWHQGTLVLATITACSADPRVTLPSAWHVVDASNGDRLVTIPPLHPAVDFGPCIPSGWPSPAGVACIDFSYHTTIYDWAGQNTTLYQLGENASGVESAVSPSGGRFFISSPTTSGYPGAFTSALVQAGPSVIVPYQYPAKLAYIKDQVACLWIDDAHLLAPGAVISIAPDAVSNGQYNVPTFVTPLPAAGVCAGRFPGGL